VSDIIDANISVVAAAAAAIAGVCTWSDTAGASFLALLLHGHSAEPAKQRRAMYWLISGYIACKSSSTGQPGKAWCQAC
jgi:hypothetical protein